MTHSLRTRLLAGIIVGMMLLLALFGLIVYTVIHRALVNRFDEALLSTTHILAASVEQDEEGIELEADVNYMPEFQSKDFPAYFQIWRRDGQVVARSPMLGTRDLSRLEGALNRPVFAAYQGINGSPERSVGLTFLASTKDDDHPQAKEGTLLNLVVSRDAGDLHRQLGFLRWFLFLTSIAVVAVSILVAVIVVQRGLYPLNAIAQEIGSVTEDDLSTRISDAPVPVEIVPIRNRLNALLARLETAFNRERRFTSNVAHELRTPLAGIRSTIEITLTRARGTDEYKKALSECLTIAQRIQTMTNNLLTLARLDSCQVNFRHELIPLKELIDCCWENFSDKAKERGITFENGIDENIKINSDRENISMVFLNLLDNAAEYTNDAGQIRVTANPIESAVEVVVANTGCSLKPDQVAQVFDRFWRGDPSRCGEVEHCGLGLALVQRIITALGGSAAVEVRPGGIFAMHLVLPV